MRSLARRPGHPRLPLERSLPWMLVTLLGGSAQAAVHYVDPINGDMSNDGSAAHPWSTLQEVFESNKIESYAPAGHPHHYGDPLVVKNPGAPVKAGDTIKLRTGYHGRIFAVEYYNTGYITIEAEEGPQPNSRQRRAPLRVQVDRAGPDRQPDVCRPLRERDALPVRQPWLDGPELRLHRRGLHAVLDLGHIRVDA